MRGISCVKRHPSKTSTWILIIIKGNQCQEQTSISHPSTKAFHISLTHKRNLRFPIEFKMSPAFKPSYTNDDYIVYVTAEDRSGSRPNGDADPSLSIDHLVVSVTWNVKRTYYSDTDLNKRWPIRDLDEEHAFDGMQLPSPLESEHSLRLLIGTMTVDHMINEKIPFQFLGNRLRWNENSSRSAGTADEDQWTPLESVRDMIHKISGVLNGMVLSGRKKMDIRVTFHKQITLSPQQYEAVGRRARRL